MVLEKTLESFLDCKEIRTIPLNPDKDLHKFTVLSVADIFANVIERVHNYKEISSIFFK